MCAQDSGPIKNAITVALASTSLVWGGLSIAADATGVVFEDHNENGVLGSSEYEISNVLVTNVVDVAIIDDNREYTLSALNNDFTIFSVVKPAGYKLPVDKDNLPKFYYSHQPEGTLVTLRFAGVDPTGPLPTSIDFPLIAYDRLNHRLCAIALSQSRCNAVFGLA